MKNHRWPIILLLIMAPATGDILSGSAPPAEFFNPFTFLLLMALYGGGALLIRELVRRWSQGWASILLLGTAYGIYEEGIVVHSFFDPTWIDLGALAEYGRYRGVNWVWALELTISWRSSPRLTMLPARTTPPAWCSLDWRSWVS